ncbi:MAG: DivIVA domain-containing protein [Deltaproteobacteria bacterium]|nr:DivIVA domain-containing protein [Deltaproteobacteria bacterium]
MRITPIDIQQQQFHKGLRGFDRREVESFLDLVAQQMGELIRQNDELQIEIRRLKVELDEHRNREETLREAMLTAQRAIDEIRETAKKEAQLVVTDAEMRAEKILHNAHGRVTKLIDEINDLKCQRARALEEMRGVLRTHQKLLETYDHDAAPQAEATVTVLERVRAPLPPAVHPVDQAKASGVG